MAVYSPSFGTDGQTTLDFFGYNDAARSVAILPDGDILVSGYATTSTGQQEFAMAMLTPDGDLDPSFGSGTGEVVTAFYGNAVAWAMNVESDGKILLTGWAFNSSGNSDFALAQYNADGSLDTSFGTSGKVTTDFAGYDDWGYSSVIAPDGTITTVGQTDTSGNNYYGLVRYNPDGSLDTLFGSGGKEVTEVVSAPFSSAYASLLSDGKLLVAGGEYTPGTTNGDFALARFNADGSLDTTFGSSGTVTTDFDDGADLAWTAAVQADGNILVGGWGVVGSDTEFGLARYNADGSLDTSFGSGGKTTVSIDGQDSLMSLQVLADGQIIGVGRAASGSGTGLMGFPGTDGDFAVVEWGSAPSTTTNPLDGLQRL